MTLVRVAPPGTVCVEGVVDLAAIADQPGDRLLAPPPETATRSRPTSTPAARPECPSWRPIRTAASSWRRTAAALLDLGPDDVVTSTLPMFHVAGTILMGVSTFLSGSTA